MNTELLIRMQREIESYYGYGAIGSGTLVIPVQTLMDWAKWLAEGLGIDRCGSHLRIRINSSHGGAEYICMEKKDHIGEHVARSAVTGDVITTWTSTVGQH